MATFQSSDPLVRELNDLGVIVDAAHLSYQSIADVLAASRAPVLCSHSGAAALSPGQTVLLRDELLRGIAASGGVVAIHFTSQTSNRTATRPPSRN